MKTLRNAAMTLLATGTLMAATSASALPQNWGDYLPAWTATASSCSVDESSASKYEFAGSQFHFLGANVSNIGPNPTGRGTSSQPITVRCNVTPMYDYVPAVPPPPGGFVGTPAAWVSDSWNTLIVGYQDPDGISTKAQVSVSLKKLSRATMMESTIATFNSNLLPSVVANEDIKQFTHKFDFQANDYYVEINLLRADTTVTTPVAYSVRLANGAFKSVLN